MTLTQPVQVRCASDVICHHPAMPLLPSQHCLGEATIALRILCNALSLQPAISAEQ